MFKSDKSGQLSIELILIAGFILVIVILVASIAGQQTQLNNVMSTAKTASISAANDIAYNNSNSPIIRFNNITFSNGQITISMYSNNNLTPNNINYIQNKVLQNISYALGNPIQDNKVKGSYNYTVVVVNVT